MPTIRTERSLYTLPGDEAEWLSHDCPGLPDDLHARVWTALLNVGSRHAAVAVPMSDEERRAVVAALDARPLRKVGPTRRNGA